MAFDGISTAVQPTRALGRVARRTTDADRGILNRGLPTARVRSVVFDPTSSVIVMRLDNGEQVRARVRYDGRPAPGVYTMRRLVSDIHDATAFVPDRPMGGTPNRDGYVLAFDSPLRATLAGVQQFTVSIDGSRSRSTTHRPFALKQVADVPDASVPVAGDAATSTPSSTDAGATPDAGVSTSDDASDDRGTDGRSTDNNATANRGTGDSTGADTVTFSITWWGHFGEDLSARVRIYGLPRKGKPVQLDERTVEDPDKQGGKANDRLEPAVLEVPRYARYKIAISPLNEKPNDRYKATTIELKIDKKRRAVTIDQELAYQRDNPRSVSDTWNWKNIDPEKASDVAAVKLFGRRVTVNKLLVPRVIATNALFYGLPEKTRKEVEESIFKIGSRVPRTTTKGFFSNHSIGTAFDINENQATRQDDHFFEKHMPLLIYAVEPVVQLDPRFARFRITTAKGLTQLAASAVFNERFPSYVAALLSRNEDVVALGRLAKQISQQRDRSAIAYFESLRRQAVKLLSSGENRKKLRAVIAAEKNKALRKRLELIQTHWTTLFTWVIGADVYDKVAKKKKRIVGMIPLHPKLLEVMLQAGWSWGGDWKEQKDYMHFEDDTVKAQLLRSDP